MRAAEPGRAAGLDASANSSSAAKEALTDMPPRREAELDAVTLHNQAIIYAEEDATGAFKKLSYLIAHPPYPPETFANLLLLHCKYQNYDIAAGLLAENSHLTYKYLTPVSPTLQNLLEILDNISHLNYLIFLSQEQYDYLDASIMVQTSPEEAYRCVINTDISIIDV